MRKSQAPASLDAWSHWQRKRLLTPSWHKRRRASLLFFSISFFFSSSSFFSSCVFVCSYPFFSSLILIPFFLRLLLFSVRVLRGYRRFHLSSKQKTLSRLASLRGLVKKRRRRRRRSRRRRRCACIHTHTHTHTPTTTTKQRKREPAVRTSTAEAKKKRENKNYSTNARSPNLIRQVGSRVLAGIWNAFVYLSHINSNNNNKSPRNDRAVLAIISFPSVNHLKKLSSFFSSKRRVDTTVLFHSYAQYPPPLPLSSQQQKIFSSNHQVQNNSLVCGGLLFWERNNESSSSTYMNWNIHTKKQNNKE